MSTTTHPPVATTTATPATPTAAPTSANTATNTDELDASLTATLDVDHHCAEPHRAFVVPTDDATARTSLRVRLVRLAWSVWPFDPTPSARSLAPIHAIDRLGERF